MSASALTEDWDEVAESHDAVEAQLAAEVAGNGAVDSLADYRPNLDFHDVGEPSEEVGSEDIEAQLAAETVGYVIPDDDGASDLEFSGDPVFAVDEPPTEDHESVEAELAAETPTVVSQPPVVEATLASEVAGYEIPDEDVSDLEFSGDPVFEAAPPSTEDVEQELSAEVAAHEVETPKEVFVPPSLPPVQAPVIAVAQDDDSTEAELEAETTSYEEVVGPPEWEEKHAVAHCDPEEPELPHDHDAIEGELASETAATSFAPVAMTLQLARETAEYVPEEPISPPYVERAAKSRPLLSQVTEDSKWRDWQIDFGPVFGVAGAIVTATVNPQVPFRGEKLTATDTGTVPGRGTRVLDVMVGQRSQRPAAKGSTLTAFFATSALGNGIKWDTSPGSGSTISVVISFIQTCTFDLAVFGKAVIPDA